VIPDPYPDLHGAPLSDPTVTDGGDPADEERPELSEADSRLLDALSQPAPPVVTAVEDAPRAGAPGHGERPPVRPASGDQRSLTPVFQEPTD
jgi:hypothetical protein